MVEIIPLGAVKENKFEFRQALERGRAAGSYVPEPTASPLFVVLPEAALGSAIAGLLAAPQEAGDASRRAQDENGSSHPLDLAHHPLAPRGSLGSDAAEELH